MSSLIRLALESPFIIGKSYLPDSKSKLKQTEFRGERERRDGERRTDEGRKKGGGKGEGEKESWDLHFIQMLQPKLV